MTKSLLQILIFGWIVHKLIHDDIGAKRWRLSLS